MRVYEEGENLISVEKQRKDHPFSIYAKFSEKLTPHK